ncbi:MAG: hypothetical protein IKC22_06300 [Bacilli bacterium]|nr:hypothetical protein [Bacilli bacterium]
MGKNNKKKKEKILMPVWLNIIFTLGSKVILLFLTKIKHNRKALKNHKEGFLLLYNHYSNKDHFIIKDALNFRRVNYVVASSYLLTKPVGPILRMARAISKEQFKPDLVAIRKIKKSIDQKGIVAIAPTGQTTVDGNPSFMPDTIVKLIKLVKSDVVALKSKGSYLCFPKWRGSKRKCRIQTEFVTVLKKEELKTLSDQEIFERVYDAIYVSEDADQLTLKRVIKGKSLIQGLENIFTVCPKCNNRHSYISIGNKLICEKCKNEITMDKYGFLHPLKDSDICFDTVSKWLSWEKDFLGKEFINGYIYQEDVILKSNLKDPLKMEEIGSGKIILSKDEFKLVGKILDQDVEKVYKMEQIPQLPFDPGVRFEIPNEEMFLRAYPNDPKSVMDYVLIFDYLNDLKLIKENNHEN